MKVQPTVSGCHAAALSNPSDLLCINKHPLFSHNGGGNNSLNNKNRSIYTDFCDTESQLSSSQKQQKARSRRAQYHRLLSLEKPDEV